jgi:seryl-tRNA synthetase
MAALYDEFMEVHTNLKHQLFEATQEGQRRQSEERKLEKKRKENEKKMMGMKASAEKEIDNLINNREKKISKADEFYYTLGWLAKHVGTITAKMPDFLEASFVKHFGEVEHTVVDSTKVGPAGYTSQWRLSMEASLKKAENIPATLTDYLNPAGKKVSKTSFIWSLIDDYGFKFGKKQDTLDIMRCVPIEYVPMFNAGMNA